MMATGPAIGRRAPATAPAPARRAPIWRRAIPYAGTILIFALIFWRIPLHKVGHALAEVPVVRFLALFIPY